MLWNLAPMFCICSIRFDGMGARPDLLFSTSEELVDVIGPSALVKAVPRGVGIIADNWEIRLLDPSKMPEAASVVLVFLLASSCS